MKNFLILIIFLLFKQFYFYNINLNSVKKSFILYNDKEIPLFEPYDKENTECLVLYTGLNSIITYDFYSYLINNLASRNMSICIYNNNYITDSKKFYKELGKKYKEIIPIGHSSGCTTLINNNFNNKLISKNILLDPVDSRIFKLNNFNLKNIKEILLFKAEKAYIGNPISFIPSFFEINENTLTIRNKFKIIKKNYKNYGHCDILNPLYSNLIYKRANLICDGTSNRKLSNLYNYIDNVSDDIYKFVKDINKNKLEELEELEESEESEESEEINENNNLFNFLQRGQF